ncbi:CHAT domain-containing protein [Aquimarina sp. 2304DJ70-9]|uniref:CHAT domain-containing protein n=1 Tax=Aquimarina penaris TaxID=3231044 RepID=UPI003463344A
MTLKKTTTIFLLFFFNYCIGQYSIDWQSLLKADIPSENKTKQIDSIIDLHSVDNDSILERLTHKYAIWLYRNKEIDKAINLAKYSLTIKKKYFAKDTTLVQLGLNNLAFFYYKKKKYVKSIGYYQELLALHSKNNAAAEAYSELGRCYKALGDYYKSVTYFELAHSLLLEHSNFKQIIINAGNASECYAKLGNKNLYNRGIKNLMIADSLSEVIQSRNYRRYNIKIAIGNLYNQDKILNVEKARYYYDQALDIAKTSQDSLKIALVKGLIGNLYNGIDPDQGIKFQNHALTFSGQIDTLQRIASFINLGFCHTRKKEFDEGVAYYQDAIKLLTVTNKNSSQITTKDLYDTFNKSKLLTALTELADTYLKKHKTLKNKESLLNSISLFLLADELIDLIRIESREFQSKLYWRKQSSDLYGKAIEACFLAKDIENAFYFMEKNKALLLTEDINNGKIRQSLALPDDITNQETMIKKKIFFLESIKNDPETLKDSITIELLDQKNQLKNLQDSIQKSFPEYNPFDLQPNVISLKEVQQAIEKNTIILEYNISEHENYGLISENKGYTPIHNGSNYGVKTTTNAYILYISKHNIQCIEIEDVSGLKQEISSLVEQASTPFKTKEALISYANIAYKVYSKLFPTQELKERIKNKKVKIIPDSYLNYLPFEALVTSPIVHKKLNYLIEDSEISYGYSYSFLENTKGTRNIEYNSFLGIAPRNFDVYNMPSLENSATELLNIKDYFDGEIYVDNRATKKEFLSTLQDHNIIHLATHADALDSISPWIAFNDHKLNLEELYFTQNSADLVVLSGCNTLKGKQETGEGVMSLARGFFHSGAKSVISSLWSVDDRSTTYIMNDFYKYLKKGHSKSKALRTAKLNYLQNHSLSETSPHFWATFVLSGDASPLQTQYSIPKFWLVLAFLAVLLSVFLYKKI